MTLIRLMSKQNINDMILVPILTHTTIDLAILVCNKTNGDHEKIAVYKKVA